jgi:hypothetical protein
LSKGEGGETSGNSWEAPQSKGIPSIAEITAKVENDWQGVRNSLRPMTFQLKTVHATLLKALQLSKKLARWAMKLVYEEKKKEQVRTGEAFIAIIAIVSWQSWITFSLLVNRLRVKRELAGLMLTQEIS